ncbi:unnamed protein product [Dovyalis caffra]|uniref:Uncharacterized protein n=1 Tax=Dovyalis caffra TaxID=77055 RepID=A0AAV1RME2_9ROSI|nr:unnamed protein product [Dovyalis caffra]
MHGEKERIGSVVLYRDQQCHKELSRVSGHRDRVEGEWQINDKRSGDKLGISHILDVSGTSSHVPFRISTPYSFDIDVYHLGSFMARIFDVGCKSGSACVGGICIGGIEVEVIDGMPSIGRKEIEGHHWDRVSMDRRSSE